MCINTREYINLNPKNISLKLVSDRKRKEQTEEQINYLLNMFEEKRKEEEEEELEADLRAKIVEKCIYLFICAYSHSVPRNLITFLKLNLNRS